MGLIVSSPNKIKRVAIVQSNYIPWKGYFDIINMVDEFILYDDVQYTKNDWRNRNRIKTGNGVKWITIPVRHKTLFQKIYETRISNIIWNKKHWKSICQWYGKAKYFEIYKDMFQELYLGSNDVYLSKVNHRFITNICKILGIHTKITWSMDYQVSGDKTERLVDLCKQTRATEYISGPSAKGYLDEVMFRSEGIGLRYMDYSGYLEYNQLYPPFEHAVSVIDLILNEGDDACNYMKTMRK